MNQISASITGHGHYLPQKVVKNVDFLGVMDTSDEWIQQRSGIQERRHVSEGETSSFLAEKAARMALQKAGLQPADLDYIVVATLSPEHFFPGTGSFLQRRLEIPGIPVLDIRAQCSGFLYGLDLARNFILSGAYKKILLVGVEVQSVALDFSTEGRDTAVLFGDGAGAVVIEAKDSGEGILKCSVHADGKHAEKLWIEAPNTIKSKHMTEEDFNSKKHHPKMDGKFVFKNAVETLPKVVFENLKANGKKIDEVNFFLFHQANLRINEFVANAMQIPPEKTHNNIQKYGNTSAASLPILLSECLESGKIKKGDLVSLAAFGAGFTWGACLIRI